MLHTAVSNTSVPLVASLCPPAGLQCANLLRVWVVVLIISAQRHGHDCFFHTPSSSQQTDMAAVSSSFYSCYRCLAYSPPLLLQSSTIPQADVGNTDDSASLIWINSLKKRRGVGRRRANGRPLCIRICTGGKVSVCPMRGENAGKVLSYSWCVSRGEESRLRTANRARWHLITKGKHKEAPQPAAGLLEGRVGVIQRVHETNTNHFHTFIHDKSSRLLLRLLRLLWCHKFVWTINYWQKILLYIKYKPHIGTLKWSE